MTKPTTEFPSCFYCCPTCPGWGVFETGRGTTELQRCDDCDLYPTDEDAWIAALRVVKGETAPGKLYPPPRSIRIAIIGDLMTGLFALPSYVAGVQRLLDADPLADGSDLEPPTGLTDRQMRKIEALGWIFVENDGYGTYLGEPGSDQWEIFIPADEYHQVDDYVPGYKRDIADLTPLGRLVQAVICNAAEGGSTHWGLIRNYRHHVDGVEVPASFEVRDMEDPADPWNTITSEKITEALKRCAATGPRAFRYRQALRNPDDADFDAEDADVLVQVAAYGSVTFA